MQLSKCQLWRQYWGNESQQQHPISPVHTETWLQDLLEYSELYQLLTTYMFWDLNIMTIERYTLFMVLSWSSTQLVNEKCCQPNCLQLPDKGVYHVTNWHTSQLVLTLDS